jgi:WD40 repeat protein/serine/threonine protein kinase
MIAFLCSGCQKQLSANEALAGKKVKCRTCGQMTVIPPRAAAAGKSMLDMRTLAPSRAVDGTQAGAGADMGFDSSLTSFLAPPEADGELGRLGGFRILTILGHGGMGVVFQGEDPKLGRQVAIKAMLPHLAGSKSGQERFLREARAAALLEHDHIVPIFHVGEDRGAPFLVMSFLKGEPLDERLRHDKALAIAEALRIGREIAEGLAAAHERGLIHRDIKLANIWLEAPKQRVRILDFGLARAEGDKSNLTQLGAIIGTPAYMAPEQAGGVKLDGRCDLWSLGVVLYRLTAGKLPFVGSDLMSTLMAVSTEQPAPPAKLNAAVPAGLSDLVMKLLQKEPARRPDSAREVVAALEALEREITIADSKRAVAVPGSPFADLTETAAAEPPSQKPVRKPAAAPTRTRKPPPRRMFVMVGAGAVVALVLILGGIVLFWPTANGTVRIESDDPNVKVTFDKDGPTITGADKKPISLSPGKHGIVVTRGNFTFETESFVLKKGEAVTLKVEFQGGQVRIVKDGTLLAWGNLPRQPKSLPPVPKQKVGEVRPPVPEEKVGEIRNLKGTPGGVWGVALSPDCRYALSTSGDDGSIRLWDIHSGMQIRSYSGHTAATHAVAFLPNGREFLSCSADGTIRHWQVEDGKQLYLADLKGALYDVAVSPDGRLALAAHHDQMLHLWDIKDWKEIRRFKGHGQTLLQRVVFSADGRRALSGSWDKTMRLWDVETGNQLKCFTPHQDYVMGVALSPDARLALSGSGSPGGDGELILWDVASEKELRRFHGHKGRVAGVAFSPDGRIVLSGGDDHSVRLWEVSTAKELHRFDGHQGSVYSVVFSRDGRYALTGSHDKTVRLWRLPAPPEEKTAEEQVKAVMARLKELNPGFDGTHKHVVNDAGVVMELQFLTDKVKDISPVQALAGLQKLRCPGSGPGQGLLADLSPLKGMKLTDLWCYHTNVADLEPLRGMPLEVLNCDDTKVVDLSPLQGMKLRDLLIKATLVADLSPISDMKLTHLNIGQTRVKHLIGLKGMKLTHLWCYDTNVADLAPLRGMPLEWLNCERTKVTDLSPLQGMKLIRLEIQAIQVADLSPLRGMPLKELHCDFKRERDAPILRSIKTLETINGNRAKDVLK